VLAYEPGDAILGAAPFTHVLGQSGTMNAALLAGARIAVPGRFEPARALAEMARTGTSVLLGVPTMCVALCAAARDSPVRPPLRVAHIGGAPLPDEVRVDFERTFGCPVHEGYGLTELSGMAAAQPVGVPRVAGTVGVYPREVEEALYRHPDVREACVAGLPDAALGEEVAAFVVLAPGATADPDALRAFAAGQVAAYKYPRRIVYCETLPKSPTGKVLKRELVRSVVASPDDT
jgi:long-chain acyl-CoA synthetase